MKKDNGRDLVVSIIIILFAVAVVFVLLVKLKILFRQ